MKKKFHYGDLCFLKRDFIGYSKGTFVIVGLTYSELYGGGDTSRYVFYPMDKKGCIVNSVAWAGEGDLELENNIRREDFVNSVVEFLSRYTSRVKA